MNGHDGTGSVHYLKPCLAQLPVDSMFQIHGDPDRVLAPLATDAGGVRDDGRVWCVVVARNQGAAVLGGLVPLPGDTPVQPVRLMAPMQLAPEA